MRKGIFIPDITVEMFKNASLEAVEELLASGTMEDIEIPDRPHGEWITKKDSLQTFCSHCDKAIPYSDEYDFSDFILCPYCGASMQKEGEKLENDRRGIPGIQEEDEKSE